MNTPILRWLLDLDRIPADASDVRLSFEHPWPAWAWPLLALAFAWLATWSYRRLSAPRRWRIGLSAVRLSALLLLVLLLAGPQAELPRERVERDWVLVLVDRSESMTLGDAPVLAQPDGTAAPAPPGTSRDAQLRSVLEAAAPTFAELSNERIVRWFGFESGAYPVEPAEGDVVPAFDAAEGRRTDLGRALDQALRRAAARPIAGVVVLGDGRLTEPLDRRVVRRLRDDAIEVHVVPLGSGEPLGDVAVGRVDAPSRAFTRDRVPVTVRLERTGAKAAAPVTVRLVDELSGEVLDEREADADIDELVLVAEPELVGETTWRVEVEGREADLVPDNDRRRLRLELVDRPLRVLFVEGYPRWEYRYLKNMLVREASIESSVMLLSADRDFAQEGNAPITRVPRTSEEFERFDVVVLGDVPAGFLSADQQALVRDLVAERGAGLLWIAGERSMPQSWTGSLLSDLLPFEGSLQLPLMGAPVTMRPTDAADRAGVLRMQLAGRADGWPAELADAQTGWSRLFWAQRIEPERLKPTAEVLATVADAPSAELEGLPLVIAMRFGAGRALYVASDELWRWRYGRGETLHDQFWIPLIRLLGRDALSGQAGGAELLVEPRRVELGRPVQLRLEVRDETLRRRLGGGVAVEVTTSDGERVTDLELVPGETAAATFTGVFRATQPGDLVVRVIDPGLEGAEDLRLESAVEVFTRDDELRAPEADHALLASLAADTGGRVLPPGDLDGLRRMRNRAIRIDDPIRESLWDVPLVFCLLLGLLAAEWIGRRVVRLV